MYIEISFLLSLKPLPSRHHTLPKYCQLETPFSRRNSDIRSPPPVIDKQRILDKRTAVELVVNVRSGRVDVGPRGESRVRKSPGWRRDLTDQRPVLDPAQFRRPKYAGLTTGVARIHTPHQQVALLDGC